MKNLLMYLMEILLKNGTIEKCDFKLADEDTFLIILENTYFTLTRSEIILLKSEYENQLAYMKDEEYKIWNKLFKLL